MKKIRLIQNAATIISELTVKEIKQLQKQNPMALAIKEPNQDSGENIVFVVEFKNAAFGDINDSKITFVDADAEGCACLTLLIPANTQDKAAYLFDKYAVAINYLKVVEKNAKKALKEHTISKADFAKEIINLDAETTVGEALEEADIIVKAEPACDCENGCAKKDKKESK